MLQTPAPAICGSRAATSCPSSTSTTHDVAVARLANLGSFASAADPPCLRVRAGMPSRGASWLRLSDTSSAACGGSAAALVLATQEFVANWRTAVTAPLECCIAGADGQPWPYRSAWAGGVPTRNSRRLVARLPNSWVDAVVSRRRRDGSSSSAPAVECWSTRASAPRGRLAVCDPTAARPRIDTRRDHLEPALVDGGEVDSRGPRPLTPNPSASGISNSTSATRSTALAGIQATLRQRPPTNCYSITAVFIPSWAARIAVTYPPGPEAITMQSYEVTG
jgi:hypothetical protein